MCSKHVTASATMCLLVTLVLVSHYFILHRRGKINKFGAQFKKVSACNRLHTAYHIFQIISLQLVIIYNSFNHDSYRQLVDFLPTICPHFLIPETSHYTHKTIPLLVPID